MRIEVLHIDGCPHFPGTVDAVKNALWQFGLTCPIIEKRDGSVDGDEHQFFRITNLPHQRVGYH
jgi:hypothetical protein